MNTASEEMRDDLRRVIENYPSATVTEIVVILEILKQEWFDRLRNCDHPDAQKPPT